MYSFTYWIYSDSLASYIHVAERNKRKVYNERSLYGGLQIRFSDKPLIEKKFPFTVRIYFQQSFRFCSNVYTNNSVTILFNYFLFDIRHPLS